MTDASELEIIENAPPLPHEKPRIVHGRVMQASSTERMIAACGGALVTSLLSTIALIALRSQTT